MFRSGTHGLNEELGRRRGREGKKECVLCGDECESVSHIYIVGLFSIYKYYRVAEVESKPGR